MKELFYIIAATVQTPDITTLPHAKDNSIDIIINIVFSLAGGLALLFIAIGGLQYILSTGDPQKAANARTTVIYALVGLVVTVLARAIIKFAIGSL